MTVRFAQNKDIPAIIALLRQVGQVHHQGRPDLFRADAQKYDAAALAALLKEESRPIFVAEQDGQVVGYGFCILETQQDHPVLADRKELYIDDLCVDRQLRGQGAGTAIYRHICRYARSLGCDDITLNVWAFNQNALEFYKKLGLTPRKITMEADLEDA